MISSSSCLPSLLFILVGATHHHLPSGDGQLGLTYGNALQSVITPKRSDALTRTIQEHLGNKRYQDAIEEGVRQVHDFISSGPPTFLENLRDLWEESSVWDRIGMAVAAILGACALYVLVQLHRCRSFARKLRWLATSSSNQCSRQTCCLCLAPIIPTLAPPPSAPAVLTCGHQYHSKCISSWLRETGTCPLCRQRHVGKATALPHGAISSLQVNPADFAKGVLFAHPGIWRHYKIEVTRHGVTYHPISLAAHLWSSVNAQSLKQLN